MFGATVHRRIFITLLALLGVCMVTSVWASNLVWMLMALNWLLEGRWADKWRLARESRLLHAFVALYLLGVVGLLWSSNLSAGLNALEIKLPLLVLPLILLTTHPLTGQARHVVLWLYSLAVFVVSIIGVVRMFSIPELPYREAIPYISHIRFALNCCMVLFLCFGVLIRKEPILQRIMAVVVMLWLLVFLLLLRSYTAAVVVTVVSIVVVMVRYRRWYWILLWLVIMVAAGVVIGREVKSYYELKPMAVEPLHPCTANGNMYEHAQDGLIECGNYINNYVCHEELNSEWPYHSSMDLGELTPCGYTVESTLIRYLNALDLPKDSMGIAQLTAQQVAEIERGVANPVCENASPVRKMVYVFLFEFEYGRHTHAVKGFSMLQRVELWSAAMKVFTRHPWFGVGTGDVNDELHAQLRAQQSEIADNGQGVHNQYITFLVAFGIIGFGLLVFMFGRAIPALHRQPTILIAWLLVILISCVSENTLGTLAGILFCSWFLSFRSKN